ncbi:MAG: ComF family protein, partial [Burkholderiales bacterium]|nr:ComF family protein [Burkholderiales bacterium]
NRRGAFVVDAPVAGLHLALVDDVTTTGATAAEAARSLLGQGAARVDLWVVARTPQGSIT